MVTIRQALFYAMTRYYDVIHGQARCIAGRGFTDEPADQAYKLSLWEDRLQKCHFTSIKLRVVVSPGRVAITKAKFQIRQRRAATTNAQNRQISNLPTPLPA